MADSVRKDIMDAVIAALNLVDAGATYVSTIAHVSESLPKSIEQIETIFENQLAGVTNGADAVKALMAYRQIRAKAEAAKADAAGKIQGALNTGYELESLIERRVALRAAWKTFFGQFPALAQIRTLAEAEVRTYMDTLNRGITNE